MTMKRSDHYDQANELVWQARRLIKAGFSVEPLGAIEVEQVELLLKAAQVHATLAAAGPGVEQEALAAERDAARAVAAAEGQRPRSPRPHAYSDQDGYCGTWGCGLEAAAHPLASALDKAQGKPADRFYRAPMGTGVCLECGQGPSGLHLADCSHSRAALDMLAGSIAPNPAPSGRAPGFDAAGNRSIDRVEFTRNDDCAELDRDTFGDCDGPIRQYDQNGTEFGQPAGGVVLLCWSHARQAMKRDRIKPRPIPDGAAR